MNLDPSIRSNFLDLLRPPAGYRLGNAIGTTFSMDFVALTAVLLAFVDSEAEGGLAGLSVPELLSAIARLNQRVRVYVDGGHLSGIDANRHGKLASLLDGFLCDSSIETGCFHPKVWVARYLPRLTAQYDNLPPIIRVICTSRNLATSSFWELFAFFEGEERKTKCADSFATDIGSFLDQLQRQTQIDDKILLELREALGRTEFKLPRPMARRCNFLAQWPTGPALWEAFPRRGKEVLIVSPFLRAEFLREVMPGYDHITLVSSQREFDRLSDGFYEQLRSRTDFYVVNSAEDEEGATAMELHAKLYVCEDGAKRLVLLGSANGSSSAWRSRNVEAMLAFSPGISIEQFLNSYIRSADPESHALRGWIEVYQRRPVIETEEERIATLFDRMQKLIARSALRATYSEPSRTIHLVGTNKLSSAELAQAAKGLTIRCAPLSMFRKNEDLVDASALQSEGIDYQGIEVADLTDFFYFVIRSSGNLQRRFVLIVKNDYRHLRAHRDSAVLREFLDADAFQYCMRSILFDSASVASARPRIKGKSNGPKTADLLAEISLEDVLQACTEDSSRIAEISRLLALFDKKHENREDLQEFRRFWTSFCDACALEKDFRV